MGKKQKKRDRKDREKSFLKKQGKQRKAREEWESLSPEEQEQRKKDFEMARNVERQKEFFNAPAPRTEVRQLFNSMAVNLNAIQDQNMMLEKRVNFLERILEFTLVHVHRTDDETGTVSEIFGPIANSQSKSMAVRDMRSVEDKSREIAEIENPHILLDNLEAWLAEKDERNMLKNPRFFPLELIKNITLAYYGIPEDKKDDEDYVKEVEARVNEVLKRATAIMDGYVPEQRYFLERPQQIVPAYERKQREEMEKLRRQAAGVVAVEDVSDEPETDDDSAEELTDGCIGSGIEGDLEMESVDPVETPGVTTEGEV